MGKTGIAIQCKKNKSPKEYSDDSYVKPNLRLLKLTEDVFQRENQESKKACAWTTDALYRESVEKMKTWEQQGAECVNLETGTFYTVAKELNIEAIYFGFILDLINTEKWTGWGGLDDELKGKVVNMKSNLDLVEDLAVKIAREIKQSDDFSI